MGCVRGVDSPTPLVPPGLLEPEEVSVTVVGLPRYPNPNERPWAEAGPVAEDRVGSLEE